MYMGPPSIENLVGVTQSSSWNESDQSIRVTIKLNSNPPGPYIALSLVFYPVWEPSSGHSERSEESDSEGLRRITGITHIESIDLVFQPHHPHSLLEKFKVKTLLK